MNTKVIVAIIITFFVAVFAFMGIWLLQVGLDFYKTFFTEPTIPADDREYYINDFTLPKSSFPLKVKWRVDLGDATDELPAYKNGMVYMPANGKQGNSWYGIKAATGEVVWSQKASKWTFNQCLTEKYLVIGGNWDFKTLDPKTGRIIWEPEKRRQIDRASCSEKYVYSTSIGAGSLIQVQDLETGDSYWLGENPIRANVHDVLYNSEAKELLVSYGDSFIIYDPQTGREKASFPKVGYGPSNGMWERGPMYVLDKGELFLEDAVVDAKTGEVIHRRDDRYGTIVPPTVTTDTMYIAARYYGVAAYNRDDYSIKWVYPSPQKKFGSLPLHTLSQVVILDGVGYIIFSDATLRALDLASGEELGYWQLNYDDLWDWPVCSYPSPFPGCIESARAGLAVSENSLFVSFGDGTLYAFQK